MVGRMGTGWHDTKLGKPCVQDFKKLPSPQPANWIYNYISAAVGRCRGWPSHRRAGGLWEIEGTLCGHRVLSNPLWGPWVLVHTRFVWALWASLVGMGFDSKREFAPPTILLGLLHCPWARGISYSTWDILLQECTEELYKKGLQTQIIMMVWSLT